MSDEIAVTPGGTLAQARDAMGVTQRDVADSLNLSVDIIDAIERSDNARLPAPVFTRGYVRAYARLLNLDPEPLVLEFDEQHGTVVPAPEESTSTKNSPAQTSLVVGVGVVVLISVLILIVVAMYREEGDALPAKAEPDTQQDLASQVDVGEEVTTSAQPEPATAPGSRAESEEETPAEISLAEGNALVGSSDATVSAALDSVPASEGNVGNAAASTDTVEVSEALRPADAMDAGNPSAPPPSPGITRLTEAGEESLRLTFSEDCWVEIKDPSGSTLYADMGKAGTRMVFRGGGPFHIVLGYAPGVSLEYNDEIVALTPHTRNNVASVVLGQ